MHNPNSPHYKTSQKLHFTTRSTWKNFQLLPVRWNNSLIKLFSLSSRVLHAILSHLLRFCIFLSFSILLYSLCVCVSLSLSVSVCVSVCASSIMREWGWTSLFRSLNVKRSDITQPILCTIRQMEKPRVILAVSSSPTHMLNRGNQVLEGPSIFKLPLS